MSQSRMQLGKRMGVHLLDYGASRQSSVDDIVRRIRRLPGNLTTCRFPDGEVLATGHDGCDLMLPNPIALATGQIPNLPASWRDKFQIPNINGRNV